MAVGKEIRKKIGSVENTQKITGAMQLVAASKMRRTRERMEQGRPYSDHIRQVIGHLANSNPEYRHTYMNAREVRRMGYIVVSTDKGLCGGLNANLFRELVRTMAEWDAQGIGIDLSLIGNKAAAFFRALGGNVVATINNIGEQPAVETLIGGVKVMLDAFEAGDIDRLDIISNEFVNTMTQRPTIKQLLPLDPEDDEEPSAGEREGLAPRMGSLKRRWDYIYEPDARQLIDGLVTRFIEAQVYHAVIENTACEQAAKMIAMKNATDAAEELIDELTLLYNNARQASITQEIAEIVGGAAAV
ncbi:MAG: F0F1 ATP synthase subunit gamma [Gammaproteobacteria bacterium]|nr:F0F1 ATP synthase subunit gamma [Gammaproteobacteria bacterium]